MFFSKFSTPPPALITHGNTCRWTKRKRPHPPSSPPHPRAAAAGSKAVAVTGGHWFLAKEGGPRERFWEQLEGFLASTHSSR